MIYAFIGVLAILIYLMVSGSPARPPRTRR
jgi:hypothetical protein